MWRLVQNIQFRGIFLYYKNIVSKNLRPEFCNIALKTVFSKGQKLAPENWSYNLVELVIMLPYDRPTCLSPIL